VSLALVVSGCGGHPGRAETDASRYASYRAGDIFTEPYADGVCGRQVTYLNFYVYEDVDPTGVSCAEAIHVVLALARNVRARERLPGGDCYPGVCAISGGMPAAGFRCEILGNGAEGQVDVVCRRGAQRIEMLSDTEGHSRAATLGPTTTPVDKLPPEP
jgi:hypothetical protein